MKKIIALALPLMFLGLMTIPAGNAVITPVDVEETQRVCGDCGQEIEIPFNEHMNDGLLNAYMHARSSIRPLYCRDCWAKRRPPRRSRY